MHERLSADGSPKGQDISESLLQFSRVHTLRLKGMKGLKSQFDQIIHNGLHITAVVLSYVNTGIDSSRRAYTAFRQ